MTRDTVLVVDDDPDIRDTLVAALDIFGIPALTAGNGVEALEAMRSSHKIGLVLLDLMMPELSGEDVLREAQRDPSIADLPVVVLSGNNEAARTAARMGARGFLAKPIELDDLVQAVGRYVPVPAHTLDAARVGE